MAAEDYFIDLFDPSDCDEPCETVCKRCGVGGLEWGNDGRGWYLIDLNGNAHKCSAKDLQRVAARDFE